MTLEETIEAVVERVVERAFERRFPASASPELVTIPEAAELAKVSEPTIRKWIAGRLLKRYGTGRTIRVRRDDVLALQPKGDDARPISELATAMLGKRGR